MAAAMASDEAPRVAARVAAWPTALHALGCRRRASSAAASRSSVQIDGEVEIQTIRVPLRLSGGGIVKW